MKSLLAITISLIIVVEGFSMRAIRQNSKDVDSVRMFIKSNWGNVIRHNVEDSADLIGLPLPYSVPSMTGLFQEMYYWDTYFTNVGLIIDGNLDQAKNNTDDIIFLVDRYGFMPNGSRKGYLSRSQPPYLSMMIRDIYERTHDKIWLKKALPILEREYQFWMTKRITQVGLNRYGHQGDSITQMSIYELLFHRFGKKFESSLVNKNRDKAAIGSQFLAEAESGWDFTPRFNSRCMDYCPVDLNCNLYMYEVNFAFFYAELDIPGSSKWSEAAAKRGQLIHKYCRSVNDHLFYDYDFKNNELSTVLSAANFNILWSGVAYKQDAKVIQNNLSLLEFTYGIVACAPGIRVFNYQWDYPNVWANIQYLAIAGLNKYGYTNDAHRVAEKFTNVVAANFKSTNNLWEKYNATNGSINVYNEYKMPTMMGWTAGVFVYAADYLRK